MVPRWQCQPREHSVIGFDYASAGGAFGAGSVRISRRVPRWRASAIAPR